MLSAKLIFRTVARWTDVRTNVRTSVTGRGHPEPRKRHRRGSKLDRTEVRLTAAEKSRWQKHADKLHVSLSELVRIKMNDSEVRVAMTADPALLEELRRQGNNLNQLMHAAHAGFFIKPSRVEAVLEDLQALLKREITR
jgi:hypothetical protein